MKAPSCYVCDRNLLTVQNPSTDDFVLVYFGGPGWLLEGPGHPANAFWFCREHASLGQERKSMYYKTALADIDTVLGRPYSGPA